MLNRREEANHIILKASDIDKNNPLVKLNSWFLKNNCIFDDVKPLKIDESFYGANLALVVNYLMYYLYSMGEISNAVKLSREVFNRF